MTAVGMRLRSAAKFGLLGGTAGWHWCSAALGRRRPTSPDRRRTSSPARPASSATSRFPSTARRRPRPAPSTPPPVCMTCASGRSRSRPRRARPGWPSSTPSPKPGPRTARVSAVPSTRRSLTAPGFVARAYDAADAWIVDGDTSKRWYRPDYTSVTPVPYAVGLPGHQRGPGEQTQRSAARRRHIQFDGSNPANSAGNAGHAQMYIGDGMIIQSGGSADSRVNVTAHVNYFSNEWYFRYLSTPTADPIFTKWNALGGVSGMTGPCHHGRAGLGAGRSYRQYQRAWIFYSGATGANGCTARSCGSTQQMASRMGRWACRPATGPTSAAGAIMNRFEGARSTTCRVREPSPCSADLQQVRRARWSCLLPRHPRSAEQAGPLPGSRMQAFAGGTIYYSNALGANAVVGAMDARYRSAGLLPRSGCRPVLPVPRPAEVWRRGSSTAVCTPRRAPASPRSTARSVAATKLWVRSRRRWVCRPPPSRPAPSRARDCKIPAGHHLLVCRLRCGGSHGSGEVALRWNRRSGLRARHAGGTGSQRGRRNRAGLWVRRHRRRCGRTGQREVRGGIWTAYNDLGGPHRRSAADVPPSGPARSRDRWCRTSRGVDVLLGRHRGP